MGAPGATRSLILIPARMASTRLPGKPLADIHGEPMIVQVWRRAVEADLADVVVAAAEPEIKAAIEAKGGRAVVHYDQLGCGLSTHLPPNQGPVPDDDSGDCRCQTTTQSAQTDPF